MFISGDSPTRSIRAVPLDGEELLLVGGEGHRPGTGGDTRERYATLERVRARALGRESVEYRWSAQDNTTIDSVPYVGPADAAQRPRADGDRLRQVGHDRRHRRRDDPRRPSARPREPVGRAVRPQPDQAARRGGAVRRGERAGRAALLRRPRCASAATGRSRTSRRERATSSGSTTRRWPATATTTARCSRSRPSAATSAARSTGTPPSAAGTARATARASRPDGDVLQGPAVHRLERKPVD